MRSVIDLSFSENLPFCSPFQNGKENKKLEIVAVSEKNGGIS
jgi:hypothetical protein